MKELTQHEVMQVSGAGYIQEALSSIGSYVGNGLYGLVANTGVELPLIGKVSIGSFYPDLGKDIGSTLGSQASGMIESLIAGIPLIGGWLNGLLGN